jgi:hypothetical protein
MGGRKDGRQINMNTEASNGWIPFAPPIQTGVTITEGPDGQVRVNVWGTIYPSAEIWQYGGQNGPDLIYYHREQGHPPGGLIGPRRLP